MFYVVTDSGVTSGKTINDINKIIGGKIDLDEFKVVGSDRILNMTDKDIDFVQDKRKMSRIFFGNFFRNDTKPIKIMCCILIALTLITLILTIRSYDFVQRLVEYLGELSGH